uniref:Uncharacterized protein n=1 Tax=Arundo donax TaxID=35708 RepID=A0A0A9C2U2_ARUDO
MNTNDSTTMLMAKISMSRVNHGKIIRSYHVSH